MSRTHRIAVIPGDGIGTEVVPEGLRVLDAAAAAFDFNPALESSTSQRCDYYLKHDKMLPDDWNDQIGRYRRDLLRRGRLAGKRSRPHLPVGHR